MKIYRVAETRLTYADDCGIDTYNLQRSGYTFLPAPTSDVDVLHEAAGRGCYRSWDRPNPATNTNSSYLRNIIQEVHTSVLEHGSMTLRIEGISRNDLGEVVRHRHFSYSWLSSRYADYSDEVAVTPAILSLLPETDREEMENDLDTLHYYTTESYARWFSRLRELGFSKKDARTGAREFLLGSMATEGFMTGNILAWKQFVQKRGSKGAALSMRHLASEVLHNLREVAPNSVQDLEDINV